MFKTFFAPINTYWIIREMRSETFVCRNVKRRIIGVQFTPTLASGFMEIHSEVLKERRWADVAKLTVMYLGLLTAQAPQTKSPKTWSATNLTPMNSIRRNYYHSYLYLYENWRKRVRYSSNAQACIRDVLVLNFGRDDGYPSLLRLSSVLSGMCLDSKLISPQTNSSKSLIIHHSSVIPLFDAVQSDGNSVANTWFLGQTSHLNSRIQLPPSSNNCLLLICF